MPLQKALALVGVAKQTGPGAPAANPAFAHGVSAGGMVKVDISQDRTDLTSGQRSALHADRTEVAGSFDITMPAFPRSLGLWLWAALGGKATTGAGPYTHTLTPASTLPLLTVFGSLDGQLVAISDCMVDEVEVSWDETKHPDIHVTGLGGAIDFAPTFTPVVDDTAIDYLLSAGGTFKLDVDSDTPATAPIKSGSVKVSNNLDPYLLSGSITPGGVFPGRQDFECAFGLIPTDLADWRAIVTGAPAGTAVSPAPVYGSFEVVFPQGAASLKLAAGRVPFVMEFPEADPGGGAVELEATGMPVQPAGGGAPLTATLINTTTSY